MKRNGYFSVMFAVFFAALLFCGVCRTLLRLDGMDLETGFYTSASWMTLAVDLVLGVALLGLFFLNVFKPVEHDYPVFRSGRGVGLLATLSGVGLLAYVAESIGWLTLTGNPGIALDSVLGLMCAMLGAYSALALFVTGVLLMRRSDSMLGGVLLLFTCLWQMMLLVVKFNSFETLVSVPDNLLTMLFMVFASMFMVGHARTLGGFNRKDGRNYTISSGLCTSLCGLVLVIPNYVYCFVNRTLLLPAPLLGGMESVYVLFFSLYALAFVRRLCSCIRAV